VKTLTNSTKKGPSFIGALTLCGEVALAVTISAAALLSSGVGFPTVSTAQASPSVQAAAQVVAED
jgi:hypothetical protein